MAIPSLAEFPTVPLHISDAEGLYNVLDWQRIGAKCMLKHFLKYDGYLQATIEQCRYFHVPAGNIPKDSTSFGADLFYARHLRKQNFVLWCSPTERPDLGGKESDDSRLMMEAEDQSLSVTVNQPGAYKTICVELELDALAVNTLLQSAHVHEMEGTAGSVAFDAAPQASLEEMLGGQGGASLSSYDETALASAAFRVLRTMVASWLREVSKFRNVFADYQIIHFYRWLRSPGALLYDPALRKTLLSLMKKLFVQLISEFRRLGADVVYADFNRIIICTKKRSVQDALAYIEYVTNTIRNKELFHSIDMKFLHAWEILLWCDAANYGGIKARVPKATGAEGSEGAGTPIKNKGRAKGGDRQGTDDEEEEEEDQVEEEEEEEDDEGPDLEMNWNLASYLPEAGACQKNFATVVAGYISAIYQFMQDELERVAPGSTPVRRRRRQSQSQTPASQAARRKALQQGDGGGDASSGSSGEDPLEAYSRELIRGELTQRLFSLAQKIHKKLPEHVGRGGQNDEDSVFPVHPGSHLRLTNPALEFVKALVKVLSLDPAIEKEAAKLRRDLLRLIGVGEFGEQAEWRDPCISFVLPEVICKQCNHCRDLDLCKDPHVAEAATGAGGALAPAWTCAGADCGAPYDAVDIEHQLVDALQRKTMGFVLQDLQCRKCRGVKELNMAAVCSCAGSFATSVRHSDLTVTLRTFASIADHFKMPLLKEVVQWTMKMGKIKA